jgi:hypothetical protein
MRAIYELFLQSTAFFAKNQYPISQIVIIKAVGVEHLFGRKMEEGEDRAPVQGA